MIQFMAYGGGTNSVAMLVGLKERGEKVSHILFADTGGEKPHTYQHIDLMQLWCRENGFPPITILKGSQRQQVLDGSLENECLRLGSLPSKAMGFGACSQKWKIDPQKKWFQRMEWPERPTKLIGFDAGEPHRAERGDRIEEPWAKRYPLIEWGWAREECIQAIQRAGIPLPGKSACFFCPSSKKSEILDLKYKYPDLLNRALEIERRAINGEGQAAALRSCKGLGRRFAWRDFLIEADTQPELNDAVVPEMDCGCYDGD